MGSQRTRFEKFLATRNRSDWREAGEELLKVADACDAMLSAGGVNEEDLRTVIAGASDKNALIWQNSVDLIQLLERRFSDLGDVILDMSKSRSANVRFASLCCLSHNTPGSIADQILTTSLSDRVSNIRWKAAQVARGLDRKSLVPAICAALDVEKNDKARSSISFALALLRDGYILSKSPDARFTLTVSSGAGITSSRPFSEDELNSVGLDAMVAELKSS